MRSRTAAVGSALFFLLAPGVVAGVVPWWTTRWGVHRVPWPIRGAGLFLLLVSVPVLIGAFVRFARDGLGTPAPIAPTERLVVTGAYRYVRNPMYLAVVGAIVGQALMLGQPRLLPYAAVVAVLMVCFVRFHEEPTLRRRFGATYEAYCRAVPGWWPRLHPWNG